MRSMALAGSMMLLLCSAAVAESAVDSKSHSVVETHEAKKGHGLTVVPTRRQLLAAPSSAAPGPQQATAAEKARAAQDLAQALKQRRSPSPSPSAAQLQQRAAAAAATAARLHAAAAPAPAPNAFAPAPGPAHALAPSKAKTVVPAKNSTSASTKTATKTPTSTKKKVSVPTPPATLTSGQAVALRMQRITQVFENSQINPAYGYAQNIGDGRGITFGRDGFCTGTGDGIRVIQLYATYRPRSKLASYLPALAKVSGGDTTGLDGFEAAVHAAASDAAFRYAQDVVHQNLYFKPAMSLAASVGATWPITKGEIYDACIQHGCDGAAKLAGQASAAAGGGPRRAGEGKWLKAYFAARRTTLEAGGKAWSQSVSRVDAYAAILASGNIGLKGPLNVQGVRVP